MPFVSEAQRGKCYALKARGQAGSWDCDEWSRHTKKKLPAKKSKEAAATEGDQMTFPERVVETLQITGAALQKAEAEMNEKKAADARYAEAIPAIVDKCAQCGRIDDTPEDREKLAQWLSTPEGALQVVDKLAEHVVETKEASAAELGQSVDKNGYHPAGGHTKRAHDSLSSPYVGARTGEQPESWRRFEAALGIG